MHHIALERERGEGGGGGEGETDRQAKRERDRQTERKSLVKKCKVEFISDSYCTYHIQFLYMHKGAQQHQHTNTHVCIMSINKHTSTFYLVVWPIIFYHIRL